MSGRRIGLVAVSVGVFVAINALVWQQESQLVRGEAMHLPLRADASELRVARRTVRLEYEISERIEQDRPEPAVRGTAVVRLDGERVARFVRPYDGKRLGEGEHLLQWRRGRRITVGPPTCRVEIDERERIDRAAYARLVVSEGGEPMLVGLYGAQLEPLEAGCGVDD